MTRHDPAALAHTDQVNTGRRDAALHNEATSNLFHGHGHGTDDRGPTGAGGAVPPGI